MHLIMTLSWTFARHIMLPHVQTLENHDLSDLLGQKSVEIFLKFSQGGLVSNFE